MEKLKEFRLLQALLLSGFAAFALGFSHISFGQTSMAGMEGMSEAHNSSAIQCKIQCTTAVNAKNDLLFNLQNEDKDPLPAQPLIIDISLVLLAAIFVVKLLHLLTSWRPPDRTLLCGHYADGL